MALEAHERLLGDAEALRYLIEERKLTHETIEAFNLGLKVDSDGSRWLTIPHYQNGKVVNVKKSDPPPGRERF